MKWSLVGLLAIGVVAALCASILAVGLKTQPPTHYPGCVLPATLAIDSHQSGRQTFSGQTAATDHGLARYYSGPVTEGLGPSSSPSFNLIKRC